MNRKLRYLVRCDGYEIGEPQPENLREKEDANLDSAIIGDKRAMNQWIEKNKKIFEEIIFVQISEFDYETRKERIVCTIVPIFEFKNFKIKYKNFETK